MAWCACRLHLRLHFHTTFTFTLPHLPPRPHAFASTQKLNDDLDDYWKTAPKKGDAPAAAAAAEAAPEAAAEEEAAAE